LLKKDVAWTWSEEAQEAFDTLKEKLLEFEEEYTSYEKTNCNQG
jgi:hypothetical protein